MLDEENGFYYGAKGKKIDLSCREIELLTYIIEHKHEYMKTEDLQDVLFPLTKEKYAFTDRSNALSVLMCRLRKKLKGEIKIKNIRRKGFRVC